jgi:hypothetical protein
VRRHRVYFSAKGYSEDGFFPQISQSWVAFTHACNTSVNSRRGRAVAVSACRLYASTPHGEFSTQVHSWWRASAQSLGISSSTVRRVVRRVFDRSITVIRDRLQYILNFI